jgi:two-component system phosphate regulon sensor histidine kinase PhoR
VESSVPEGAFFVAADPGCVAVLLDNLVVNGIKYNRPGGSVCVSAEADKGEVVLSVRDTGIGIPEKYRQLLFEEFFRVEQDSVPKRSGSGLGLSIVKRIVDEMGGAIEVESREGAGSVFRLRLPAWQQ